MSGSSYSLPGGPTGAVGVSDKELANTIDRLFGRDIWYDVTNGLDSDYQVNAAGDWLMVEGREALRQSLTRRIITNPGEWATKPEYGVGARLFVKAKNTLAARQELEERIRAELSKDQRVDSIDKVVIEQLSDGPGLRISVVVIPKGETQRRQPLVASVEVT